MATKKDFDKEATKHFMAIPADMMEIAQQLKDSSRLQSYTSAILAGVCSSLDLNPKDFDDRQHKAAIYAAAQFLRKYSEGTDNETNEDWIF